MGAKRVAIACQGGGSHTAFTAGVLKKLLTSPQFGNTFIITALSGTSGGALCAGLVWSRLLQKSGPKPTEPDQKQAAAAAQALEDFWTDNAADDNLIDEPWWAWSFDFYNAWVNSATVTRMRQNPLAERECKVISRIARHRMLTLLQRHLPLAELRNKALDRPLLWIGATDIIAGVSQPLKVKEDSRDQVHLLLLASASIPPLFGPTHLDSHYYWDGLYSHNPPLDCLTNLKPPPEEIWIIQINPERASHPPRSAAELVDRRNELMGNLTLTSEMYHIDAMNWLLQDPQVKPAVKQGLADLGYRPITLRKIALRADLDFASKYDRSLSLMKRLLREGELAAPQFFEESSIWTSKEEGLERARLTPRQAGHEDAAKTAELTPPLCSTTDCPLIGVCNTCDGVGPWADCLFSFGQDYLELEHKH